jgi:hypothetical protein
MSYTSRERKRRKKIATDRAQALAHKTGSSADRWFLDPGHPAMLLQRLCTPSEAVQG